MSETLVECGRFTLDTLTGRLTGPKAYFEDRGGVDAAVEKALKSATFRYGAAGASPSPQVAFLVAMQTDYAEWDGYVRTFGRSPR